MGDLEGGVEGEDGNKKGDTWHLQLDDAMIEQLKNLANYSGDDQVFSDGLPSDSGRLGSASSSRRYASQHKDSSTMLLDPPRCRDLARAVREEDESTVILMPGQMLVYPYESSTSGSSRTSNVTIDKRVDENYDASSLTPQRAKGNAPTVLLGFEQRYPDVTHTGEEIKIEVPEGGSFMGKLRAYGNTLELEPPRVRIEKKDTKEKGGTTLIARFDSDEYFRQRINPL